MTRRCVKALCSAAWCALLVACAGTPPADTVPEPDAPALPLTAPSSPHPAFEQRQRERALGLMRQGRLADAAVAWEVLTVLRPDIADYRERLADVHRQINAAVADRLPRASQAFKRGEFDSAMQVYLDVLALDPDHAQAADALRAIERERVKRNQLGKYARVTLTRRAISDSEMTSPPRPDERNAIEHASMLAGQGEFDDAIALLERRLTANPREQAARLLLADIYFRRVQDQPGLDKTVAMRSLERSVRLDPTHAGANAALRQLKSADTAPRPATATSPARPASTPTR
jgi:tetratricopeptide (TPR) repeat protein